MSAVRSMTGFASRAGSLADGTSFLLTAKSVNHRFLDLQFRLPSGCDGLESELRRVVKQHVERGHVELSLELGRSAGGGVQINEPALDALVAALRAAGARLGLTREPELASLLRVPGVLLAENKSARRGEAELHEGVATSLDPLMHTLNEVREREGTELARELRAGLARVQAAVDSVMSLREGVLQAQFERLAGKLRELLGDVRISEDRLMLEAGLLAEKSDVEEEAVRLRTHLERFQAILDRGGAVGKQLDFLLQELNREANTMLSKTGSAAGPNSLAMTALGLAIKTEIERAREQVQNLE